MSAPGTLRVISVVGARPNFVKLAALDAAFQATPSIAHRIVHAGQHYDYEMNALFFQELELPVPDYHLEVGPRPAIERLGLMMTRLEPIFREEQPDWVLVVGDVDATLAAALVAKRVGLRLGHVEAGLRSFDWTMPEEINRVLTDRIADVLFVSEASGLENLRREGVEEARLCFAGNVMIDTLHRWLPATEGRDVVARLAVPAGGYGVVTLHRPSNTEAPERLLGWMGAFEQVAVRLPLVFPLHPRTARRLAALGYRVKQPRLCLVEPVGYLDMLALLRGAHVVLTDSGGVQEETTALGVRCLTLRDSTERPATVKVGSNRVVGSDPRRLLPAVEEALATEPNVGTPRGWDGRAAERIAAWLLGRAGGTALPGVGVAAAAERGA